MHSYSFLFFLGVNNTRYPVNDCKGLILFNLRFFWTKSYSTCCLTFISLYIGKNLGLIPGFKSTA